jgi:hypothetical protein
MNATIPTDINIAGVVVGYYEDDSFVVHGFTFIPCTTLRSSRAKKP